MPATEEMKGVGSLVHDREGRLDAGGGSPIATMLSGSSNCWHGNIRISRPKSS